ncbi:MAG: aminotransferase class I/II-fold pyridoxal phosphate-dependent enzyme [Spirochaeta sp.]|nr:aminotransferase class I/II-fold pyridoxal phosphate-dependent enzyme [Spirochaeta sp.]
MNPLARALNDTLANTVVARVFSDLGRRMYFPKGIVAQAAEAKSKATKFNATVGMAYADGAPMTLPLIRELTGNLPTAETVAYAPTPGVPALRDAWKEQMLAKNPDLADVPTTRPMVVPGLTAGITMTADLFTGSGDTLLLPDLFWGNYRLIFEERRQCTMREFTFFDAAGAFDRTAFADGARAAASNGKLTVILNFPNNPAGFTPGSGDVTFIRDTLVQLADSVPVTIITDDAYFGLFYDDNAYTQSLFTLMADAHPNILAVKVDGATKEDYVWGFRVGFVTVAFQGMTAEHSAAIEQKLTGAIRSMVSNSSVLSQSILLRAFAHPQYEQQKQAAFELLEGRFRTLQDILAAKEREGRAPQLQPLPCNSGYFMSFRCNGLSAEALRVKLLESGVGTISVKDQFLRIAFAGVDREVLPELFEDVFTAAESFG